MEGKRERSAAPGIALLGIALCLARRLDGYLILC